MEGLSQRGYAVYALDLRGYGASPRDRTGWLTPLRAAGDVAAALSFIRSRQPELGPPALLGWSNGALVAQLTAQLHPDRISDLVLYGYPADPGLSFAAVEYPDSPPRQRNTAEGAASDFITPGSISKKAIAAFVTAALQADPVLVDWRAEEEFNALDPGKVSTPTLLLQGARDPYAPAEAQARLFSRLGTRDRQWVVLPGGDHAALIENTQPAFLAAVAAFLERPR